MARLLVPNTSIYKYWGKKLGADNSYHLLPYHCLSVAAVAKVCFNMRRNFCHFLAHHFDLTDEYFEKIVLFFVAVHDIGKFSEGFQNLAPDLLFKLQNKSSKKAYYIRHDTLGFLLWKKFGLKWLKDRNLFGFAEYEYADAFDFLARAVTGHHGLPPNENNKIIDDCFSADDLEACKSFIYDLSTLFLADLPSSFLPTCDGDEFCEKAQFISWWLAGITVLADWIGSNQEYFPYVSKEMPLEEYWDIACNNAKIALETIKLNCLPLIKEQSFVSLFSRNNPTPLQQAAFDLPLSSGPQLFILEDLTGSGKTEAALILAQRLLQRGISNSGFYFGLPTMATSNAMFKRINDYCSKAFSNLNEISLVLAHGKSKLNDYFQKIIAHDNELVQKNEDLPATIGCNAWFTDSRKKALLAQIGVGTIDQSLQAILPNKHQSLRLLGLFGKVLIVDEVHACDSYMNELLKDLLSFHAASDGSAILLSATLPEQTRRELIRAFSNKKVSALSNSYPLLTHISTNNIVEKDVLPRSESQRTIQVLLNDNKLEIFDTIRQMVAQDKCVCWIRNTVNDAIESYKELKNEFAENNIILFHARFTVGDRNNIENKVLKLFDENSTPEKRCGKLVIATQVVEQSLDIDFDFMVSDLAPIDLLVQRAGRLQRHQRGERSLPPTLLVYGPKPIKNAPENWYQGFFPSASHIYKNHGQLWLTANLLLEHEKFDLPSDARYLIESVYGDEAKEHIPSEFAKKVNQADGKSQAAKSFAKLNELNLNKGYKRDDVDWWEDIFAPTRLGEKMITLRLAKWQDQRLLPWHDLDANWNLSQVNVNYCKISARQPIDNNTALAKAILEVENGLPDRGKWSVLLPLEFDTEKNIWLGRAVDVNGKEVFIIYDKNVGLAYNNS